MKYFTNLLIWLCLAFSFCFAQAYDLSGSGAAALINGEELTKQELIKFLEHRYGEGSAFDLHPKVIRAALEEMITFKVMGMNLKKAKVKCNRKDYIQEAKRLEKPLFELYEKWGFKNPVSFIENLQTLVKKSPRLEKQYVAELNQMELQFQLGVDDRKKLADIWNVISKEKSIHSYVRGIVLKKYKLHPSVFKQRIVLTAHLHKYTKQKIKEAQVQEFVSKESFALQGGKVKISHIMLLLIDPFTKQAVSSEKEAEVLEKIKEIRTLIDPDYSNFGQIAEQYSEDQITKYRNGDLSWIPRWTVFAQDIADYGYLLEQGKLSQPLKTKVGYHLILVTDRKNGEALSSEEIREKAIERLVVKKKEEVLKKWLDESEIERKIID